MNARNILPLPGPLDVDPGRDVYALAGVGAAQDVAEAMLDNAVAGLPVAAYDTEILDWLKGKDVSTVATIASLLRRAWDAGVATGRAERVAEQPTVQALRADVARLAATVERGVSELGELAAERDREEARSDFLRAELGKAQAARERYCQALDAIVAAVAEAELAADDDTADCRYALHVLAAAIETAIGGASGA